MKSQAELREEYERLFAAEDYEAANEVLDLIEPVSDEEWLAVVRNAPEVDEPVPEFIKQRSRALDEILSRMRRSAAGSGASFSGTTLPSTRFSRSEPVTIASQRGS